MERCTECDSEGFFYDISGNTINDRHKKTGKLLHVYILGKPPPIDFFSIPQLLQSFYRKNYTNEYKLKKYNNHIMKYCNLHKKKDMVSSCTIDKCYENATYGLEVGKPIYCYNHSKYIPLKNFIGLEPVTPPCPYCEVICDNFEALQGHCRPRNCPKFNIDSDFDLWHKTQDLYLATYFPSINDTVERVYSFKLCDCGNFAEYGNSVYDIEPTFCRDCTKTDSIHIRNIKCIEEGCCKYPVYGHLSEKPITLDNLVKFCEDHKKTETYNFNRTLVVHSSKPVCSMEGCCRNKNWGFFEKVRDIEGDQGISSVLVFCQRHRTENMTNKPVGSGCKGPINLDTDICPYGTGGGLYKNNRVFCSECFIRSFPGDPQILKLKTKSKELRVLKMLKSEMLDYDFIHDKPIWTGGCDCTHRRRIDFRILLGNTLLAIEVDEDQHKNYKEQDDVRYNDLFMIHSGKWVFIRYNPDSYTKNGKMVKPDDKKRLVKLKESILEQIRRINNEENTELIEIHKLFFDK